VGAYPCWCVDDTGGSDCCRGTIWRISNSGIFLPRSCSHIFACSTSGRNELGILARTGAWYYGFLGNCITFECYQLSLGCCFHWGWRVFALSVFFESVELGTTISKKEPSPRFPRGWFFLTHCPQQVLLLSNNIYIREELMNCALHPAM
jgi:hypothetical protein